jgi:hypothetical protein
MTLVNNLRVYVALGSGPLSDVTTITWTDITSSVILSAGINYTNGKSYADRVARPGSLTLTLDNSAQKGTAGRWTIGGPNVTSGWDLKTPIRVTYVGSTTINLWTGYVDMISSRWDGGVRPVVQVQASDYMSQLGHTLLINALTAEMLKDSPRALWPLDEPSGAVLARSDQAYKMGNLKPQQVLYVNDGTVGGLLFGSANDIPIGADKPNSVYMAATSTNNGYCLSTDTMADWSPANPVDNETIELMYYPTEFGSAGNGIFAIEGSFAAETRAAFLTLLVDSNGYLTVTGYINKNTVYGGVSNNYSSFNSTWTSDNPVINLQQWHHIALTQTVDGSNNVTMKLYVDGTAISMNFGGSSSVAMTYSTQDATTHTFQQAIKYRPRFVVGANANNVVNTDGNSSCSLNAPGRGYFANAAIYDSALSDARVAEHARIVSGFTGETTHARFQRACGYANLPANNYTTTGTALVTMSAQPLTDGAQADRSLFDLLKEIADTEYGDIYVNGSGQLVHSGRQMRMNAAVDYTVPAQAINSDNGFDYDQTVLINKVTATSGNGLVSQSTDASSVSQYGVQEIQVAAFVDTQNQVTSTAYGLAHLQSTPTPRLRDVSIDLITLPSNLSGQLETMIGSKVADVFQITSLPSATAPTSTLTMFIEGWSDRITEHSWQRSMSTTAVSTSYSSVLTLNNATYGALNSNKLTW